MKIKGLPVLDAEEDLPFEVTKRDISNGGIQEPDSCAIALACMRECHSTAARIHIAFSYVRAKDHWDRYRTPTSIAREIIAFDRGGQFQPGEYTLLAPKKSHRLGFKWRKRGVKPYKTKRPARIHITANVRSRPVFAARVVD